MLGHEASRRGLDKGNLLVVLPHRRKRLARVQLPHLDGVAQAAARAPRIDGRRLARRQHGSVVGQEDKEGKDKGHAILLAFAHPAQRVAALAEQSGAPVTADFPSPRQLARSPRPTCFMQSPTAWRRLTSEDRGTSCVAGTACCWWGWGWGKERGGGRAAPPRRGNRARERRCAPMERALDARRAFRAKVAPVFLCARARADRLLFPSDALLFRGPALSFALGRLASATVPLDVLFPFRRRLPRACVVSMDDTATMRSSATRCPS